MDEPIVIAQGDAEVRDVSSDAEWVWADPIADCFKVGVQQDPDMMRILLRCERCNRKIYTVGEVDLWELALDAKRHALNDCTPISASRKDD